MTPRNVWSLDATLGEGPVWCDGALWFVDIKRQRVHRFDPAAPNTSGERRSWDAPAQISFLAPVEGGGFVAGLQSGLHRFDPETGAFDLLAAVEPEMPTNRLNDATVDARGRLWFGSMDNGERQPSGRFYRYSRGQLADTGLPPVAISNGPAMSPDGGTLYWVDTLGRTVNACAIGEDGTLGPSRVFAETARGEGNPDGPSVDSAGCVWVGIYGGWEARRYSPVGELLARVRFPVANITKVAFGGPDLRTAYATTARHGLKPEALAAQPEAGSLFAFDVDVPGLPANRVAL